LGSDSISPKAHHRFNFSGVVRRKKSDRVTPDDILDSLTRQAELRQRLEETDQLGIEEIAGGMAELDAVLGFNPELPPPSLKTTERSLGHLAFVIMLLTGLTFVWLFTAISKPFDLAPVDWIIRRSGVQSVFSNQAELAIVGMVALTAALLVRLRRRRPDHHLLTI
jgi:hypothetical protein